MPLLIDLKPGEKLIINGAVLENAGTNTKIRIYNESNILRQKEILTNDDIATPAARVYFCLQCAYIFPEKRDYYLDLYRTFLAQYLAACPSAQDIGDEVDNAVEAEAYYKALKASRKLLKHETSILNKLEASAEQLRQIVDAQDFTSAS